MGVGSAPTLVVVALTCCCLEVLKLVNPFGARSVDSGDGEYDDYYDYLDEGIEKVASQDPWLVLFLVVTVASASICFCCCCFWREPEEENTDKIGKPAGLRLVGRRNDSGTD